MKRCSEPHPQHATPCTLPPGTHYQHEDDQGQSWPNEAVQLAYARQQGGVGGLGKAREIARSATPRSTVRMSSPVSVEPRDPEPGTPAAYVLGHLRARPGRWVAGSDLVAVAGPAGPHQPVELRHSGWPVESRLREERWEHRMRRETRRD